MAVIIIKIIATEIITARVKFSHSLTKDKFININIQCSEKDLMTCHQRSMASVVLWYYEANKVPCLESSAAAMLSSDIS